MAMIYLCSGAAMSVMADARSYCEPQSNEGPYTSYEVGFPRGMTDIDKADLAPYKEYGTDDIFAYVPGVILERIFLRHDGIAFGTLPGRALWDE